jgi:hypothetical protein
MPASKAKHVTTLAIKYCVIVSCRGFTRYSKEDYLKFRAEGRFINDGSNVKLIGHHGPLADKEADQIFSFAARVYKAAQHKDDL